MMYFTEAVILARLDAHPTQPGDDLTHVYGVQLARGEQAWNPGNRIGQPRDPFQGPRYVIYERWSFGTVAAYPLEAGEYRHEGDARMAIARLERAGLTVRSKKVRRPGAKRDQHGFFFPLRLRVTADAALLELADRYAATAEQEAKAAQEDDGEEEPEPGRGWVKACPSCGADDPPVTTLGKTGATVTDCCESDVSHLI
ncbi:hypothetical protein ACWDRB_47235 [Nonomuraea sp. NPDC003707]